MQTLVKIWTFIRKYAGLLIAGLLTILLTVSMNRKTTQVTKPPVDTDSNGKHDEEEIQVIKTEADQLRKAADNHAQAAEVAVQKPTAPKPSKTVHDAVRRNNEIDY